MNDLAKYVGKGVALLLFQTSFIQDKVGVNYLINHKLFVNYLINHKFTFQLRYVSS